jgi:RNA polymerase sigma-70 factor (subfamily 1)
MGQGAAGGQDPSDERELVDRYRHGDGAALEALLARFEEDLRRTAGKGLPKNLRRRVSVSDILQETRLTAFERRSEFRWGGPGSFRRWVMGIAGNKVLQAIRHHLGTGKRSARREAAGDERPSSGALPSPGPSPSQVAVASELDAMARRAMDSLPPEEREVLRLAREQGLTMTEIAESRGIDPGTAKRLYGKAVVRFREAFDDLRGERHG